MKHVVSQLITKRAELKGELIHHHKRIQQLEEIIYGIGLSIQAFDETITLDDIKAKRYSDREHYFKSGEAHVMILDTLRKAQKPMRTTDITIELMKKKNLDSDNQVLLANIQKSLLQTLKKQEKGKIIHSLGKDNINGFTWELVA